MLNIFIVVFRESFEAILIVGILHAFLERKKASPRAKGYLFAGAASGFLLSIFLGFCLWQVQSLMEGNFLDLFQMGVLALAVGLIVHMCLWMNVHARTIRGELEKGAMAALEKNQMTTLFFLAGVSVLREGFETVVFLYGNFLEAIAQNEMLVFSISILLGICAGLVFWYVLKLGLKKLNLRTFFKVTTFFLLLTAGGLLLRLVQQLISKEWLTPLVPQVWNTSWLLPVDSGLGGVIFNLTGYQESPDLMSLLIYAGYWTLIYFLFRQARQAPALQPRNS